MAGEGGRHQEQPLQAAPHRQRVPRPATPRPEHERAGGGWAADPRLAIFKLTHSDNCLSQHFVQRGACIVWGIIFWCTYLYIHTSTNPQPDSSYCHPLLSFSLFARIYSLSRPIVRQPTNITDGNTSRHPLSWRLFFSPLCIILHCDDEIVKFLRYGFL